MSRRPFASSLFLTAALVACGDDSSGAGGAGGASASTSPTVAASTSPAVSVVSTSDATSVGTGGEGQGGAPGSGGAGAGGEGGEGGAGGAGGGAGGGLAWEPCDYADEPIATCARPSVPLDWARPDGETIELLVKRVPALASPARGQLWLLQGGPGGAAIGLEGPLTEAYRDAAPDLDLYLLDHRGVGGSTELGCTDLDPIPATSRPLSPDTLREEISECLVELEGTWGERLRHFDAASAGRDLGELIELLRSPEDEIFVASVSYGTRWAHRYLQQFPDQPSGVIFDSAMDETTDFYRFGENLDASSRAILEACGADAFCRGKLGDDPWATTVDLMTRIAGGHCSQGGFTLADYRALFAALSTLGPDFSPLLAAAIHRTDRCTAQDRSLLLGLRNALIVSNSVARELLSGALHFHVVFSELPGSPPADLADREAALTISNEQMLAYASAWELWPTYDPSPWLGGTAETDAPLLVLAGSLDGQAPAAQGAAFAARFDGPAQRFVEIEGGHHVVVAASPIGGGAHCGAELVAQFLSDPTGELDATCAGEVEPLDFRNVPFPGADDAWDD